MDIDKTIGEIIKTPPEAKTHIVKYFDGITGAVKLPHENSPLDTIKKFDRADMWIHAPDERYVILLCRIDTRKKAKKRRRVKKDGKKN